MSTYQIKLTPVNTFFFGGEKHSRSDKNTNGFEMDYFVKSDMYPQQTTLLGVLRYYLLMKNSLLNPQRIGKIEEANDLIGVGSFKYGFIKKEEKNGETKIITVQDYGKIQKILPLYFLNDNQKYVIAPFDHEFELTEKYGNIEMAGYNAKNGYNLCLTNLNYNTNIKFF